ncbi:REJ domain-containing protein [Duganella sacchari]|uniref:REJ domain-containing protein n=1 Tax=Duganella sacchari TaxID=551987 RepID=A0A1M7PSM0_9BURK|nr:DUF4214 domain-containing protein [Duganella sacchari]SHN20443.1 REJ domain-containing protein [Duganella sacchari]
MHYQSGLLALLIATSLIGCGGQSDTSSVQMRSAQRTQGGSSPTADDDDVVLPNDRSQYLIESKESGYVITNIPDDGTSRSYSVLRRVQFADVSLALDVDYSSQIYRLYQAAFNRKPDLAGLGHWLAILDSGTSLVTIAESFVGSAEFQQLYGVNPDNTLFLTKLYNNALHRDPDAAGLASWLRAMQLGLTRAQVLVGFSESTENKNALAPTVEKGIAYVERGVNYRPVANAGSNVQTTMKSTVTLDGSASTDANNDSIKYEWAVINKPSTSLNTLSSVSASKPYFVPDAAGTYTFSLTVNDGVRASRPAIVSVSVSAVPIAPIPDTGIYKCSQLTLSVAQALYLAGHTYLDRDHDGKPCEANDIAVESPVIIPSTPTVKQCWVNGYRRKNGTYVHGYWRSC